MKYVVEQLTIQPRRTLLQSRRKKQIRRKVLRSETKNLVDARVFTRQPNNTRNHYAKVEIS